MIAPYEGIWRVSIGARGASFLCEEPDELDLACFEELFSLLAESIRRKLMVRMKIEQGRKKQTIIS